MSAPGPLDEDTARTLASGRETIGAVLKTAQTRLKVVFVAFVVGLFAGVIAMRVYIWPTLKADLLARGASVIAQTPFDVILLQVKIGLAVGIIAALPVLAYYARVPLAERGLIPDLQIPRWKIAVVLTLALALSVVGIVYAYFLFFPIMFTFLAGNALGAGLAPMYSIVDWTEFILVLALSFGLAAQLPLLMTTFSYTGIVPYETFRDKWRYAVVGIFTFGALFSPPDPFTQLMWAMPLLLLYAISLYLSKLVTAGKRGGRTVDFFAALRRGLNRIAGAAVLGGGLAYWFYGAGGRELFNESIRPSIPEVIRPGPVADIGTATGLSPGPALAVAIAAMALLLGVLAALVVLYRETMRAQPEEGLPPPVGGETAPAERSGKAAREPDLSKEAAVGLLEEADGAEGVRDLPEATFAAMDEQAALEAAQAAVDRNDGEKAEAIFDRFDDAPDEPEVPAEASSGRMTRATTGFVDIFTEEETTEEDIGGYYHDIAFILDSLRSRAFHLVAVFMIVMVGLFMFLYRGGIGTIRADFISRIPPEVRPDPDLVQWPITLHPVEALVFEVKISALIGAVAVLPVAFYYAWPALEKRGWLHADRRAVGIWWVAITAGLLVGSAIGYLYVAPPIISFLVEDAIRSGMVVAYRVNNFFWMVFFTTVGIGILADIPISMYLFHRGNIVSYRRMRKSWRGVVLVIFVLSTFLSSSSIWTMFLLAIPTALAYLFGLGVLWVLTLGGRRGGSAERVEPAG